MDFTREPVVETVITPKEGYKLVIRSSHGGKGDEYAVDAVEVIAFGHSYFFRSLEKPKAFLLPLAEYEVLEIKEARPVLKKPVVDKPIKIGAKSKIAKAADSFEEEESGKKKRSRKRRESKVTEKIKDKPIEKEGGEEEPPASAPVKRTLLPPPTNLISDQISRYKNYLKQQGIVEEQQGDNLVNGRVPEEKPSAIEPLEQDQESADFAFPFGGEGVVPQMPSLDSKMDFLEKDDKIVDLNEEIASIPPLEEDKET